MVAVVDKSVLTLADEKTHRAMPTHFLLTSEVRRPEDLEYADFLLGPQAKASEALDLLLGVQGWRRFAEQDPAQVPAEEQRQGRGGSSAGDDRPVAAGETDLAGKRSRRVEQDTDAKEASSREQYDQRRTRRRRRRRPTRLTGRASRTAWYSDVLERLL